MEKKEFSSINYFSEYTKFWNRNLNVQLKIIRDQIHHYEIIDEMLGFQYWLNETVSSIYNEDREYSINHMADLFIHKLFAHNFESLFASLLTGERNLLHQTVSNLRTVYESIPKMYYISFFPDEIKYVILSDHVEGSETKKAEKYLKSDSAPMIFKPNEINEPKKLFRKIERKYFFNWFVRQIYSKEQIEQMKKTYGLLSISSHSSTIRRQPQEENFEENIGDTFEFIELLSFFNIVAEVNGLKTLIQEEKISGSEIMSFAEKMRAELVKDGKMYSLFPDHQDIAKKVMIHPPGPPWD